MTDHSAAAKRREWSPIATRRFAAWRGVRETPFLPALVLFITFLGFGALTSETGLGWLDTLLMAVLVFALPGQVVLVDEIARGASLVAAAIAVSATGIRLLPMTIAILPMLRHQDAPKWMEFAVAHFVAVTVWLEAMRRAPDVPGRLRAAYVLGIGCCLSLTASSGALTGYFLAAKVPDVIAAGLLFMTPLYFLLGMLVTVRTPAGAMPIVLGLVLGPVFHLFFPYFDLLLTGLIGGTISFGVSRWIVRHGGAS